ncbi:MAG: tetratricopeptide repeat protein [Candidatus Riflebacteria bacterium]|nr:tetratricopeptide repeat protein [Candidatus Riflebacteria bacterium]
MQRWFFVITLFFPIFSFLVQFPIYQASSRHQVDTLLMQADNFLKTNKVNEALKCLETAQELDPGNWKIFCMLSNCFDKQGDVKRCTLLGEKFYQEYPENPEVLYFMGRLAWKRGDSDETIEFINKALEFCPNHPLYKSALPRAYLKKVEIYQKQKKYDEAINCLKLILGLLPEDPDIYYWLGFIHELKNDRIGMLEFYKKSLDRFPGQNREKIIKKILASATEVEKSKLPPDENFKNPTSRFSNWYFRSMMEKGDFDSIEKTFQDLLRERQLFEGESYLNIAYSRFETADKNHQTLEERINDWLKTRPSSHFAFACKGHLLVTEAWEARGKGESSLVTKESKKLFEELLKSAKFCLNKAYESDPSDPIVPAKLITVAMGLGEGREEVEKQFARAIKADKNEKEAYTSKLESLKPEWGGSTSEMLEFAKKCTNEEHPQTLIPFLLITVHEEMSGMLERNADRNYFKQPGMFGRNADRNYFKQPGVWNELKSVFNRLLKDFPENNVIHNHCAFIAYQANDMEIAQREFEIIQNDWVPDLWGYNFKKFQESRDCVSNELLNKR